MSASREKKKRQNQPETPVTEAPKKGMSKCLKKTLTVIVSIVLVVAVVFLSMVSTSFFEKHVTAAVANGHKLTAADINYYYSYAYSSMQSFMGSALDPEKPLSEQPYSGEGFETWEDYLLDYAVATAADAYAIYDEAIANGHTLTEDEQAGIDNEIAMLSAYAGMYGYTNADGFIAAQYGPGCNVNSYKEYLTVNTIASSYSEGIYNAPTYTAEDINAYYTENSENFDSVTHRVFSVTPELFPEETDTEAALKLCEDAAKAMAEAANGNEQAFIDHAKELTLDEDAETYEPETATLRSNYTLASCGENYRSWLAEEARQPGDATYVANGDQGFQVVYFSEREDLSMLLPNVRHILISADAEDDEAKAAAAEKAQTILDEYLAGEQTEDAFAALAQENSMDNAEAGGLYENVAPGTMVESFEDWCFDAARQPGDTGIVESTYGYHVMYFCGSGDTYRDYKVENTMRENNYNEWNSEITADATYTITDLAKKLIADR